MSGLSSDASTQTSFILRAQGQHDRAAWDEFVMRYGLMVLTWSRRWCKQNADAEDLSQDILIHVWKNIPKFRPAEGKKFRAWLRQVSYHAFVDSLRRRNNVIVEASIVEGEMLKRAEDLARAFEQQFDEELLRMACARVREIVKPEQWKMFEQTNLLQVESHEVSRQFNKSVDAIRMNSVRIRKLIRTKMQEIEASVFV